MARREHVSINLRITPALHDTVTRLAEEHRTSLNNQLRLMIENSVDAEARRRLDDISRDMEIHWARFAARHLRMDLADELADAVMEMGDAAPVKLKVLAQLIIKHRAIEQRAITRA